MHGCSSIYALFVNTEGFVRMQLSVPNVYCIYGAYGNVWNIVYLSNQLNFHAFPTDSIYSSFHKLCGFIDDNNNKTLHCYIFRWIAYVSCTDIYCSFMSYTVWAWFFAISCLFAVNTLSTYHRSIYSDRASVNCSFSFISAGFFFSSLCFACMHMNHWTNSTQPIEKAVHTYVSISSVGFKWNARNESQTTTIGTFHVCEVVGYN